MLKIKENIECYSRPSQRDILIRIIDNETIKNNFFLAGGTARSVFYLHHRTSIDLDLFTIKKVPLDEIYLWISRTWSNESQRINQNEYILQMIIKDIKVDIVHDPLSFDEPREKYYFDEKKSVTIDSIRNIAAGKFTTLVSRREVKDFVDFFFLHKKIGAMNFEIVYQDAQKKEGMFDDSPTVAYQLENNFSLRVRSVEALAATDGHVGQHVITRTDMWLGGIVWYRNQIIKRWFKQYPPASGSI